MANWNDELMQWLEPFLARLGHKRRRQMCPLYVAGLIGPGERKSMEPIAARLAPDRYDRLHHFISSGVWDAGPLEEELARQADRMVGGRDAVLVVDDTALPKKGTNSVGVAPQYASALGKRANCQTLVSLTLARDEVPVAVGLRLFLPESWTGDPDRMKRAHVPEALAYATNEARDGARGDRPADGGGRALRDGPCRCRLWPVGAVSPGLERPRASLGRGHPQAPEGLSGRRLL